MPSIGRIITWSFSLGYAVSGIISTFLVIIARGPKAVKCPDYLNFPVFGAAQSNFFLMPFSTGERQ